MSSRASRLPTQSGHSVKRCRARVAAAALVLLLGIASAAAATLPAAAATRCSSGGFLASSRVDWWRWSVDTALLGLTDVLTSEGRVYAVFNVKTSDKSLPWQHANWSYTYEFPSSNGSNVVTQEMVATPLGLDAHSHTFTVHAPLPRELAAAAAAAAAAGRQLHAQHVTIRAVLKERNASYEHVPFCVNPDQALDAPARAPQQLIACTSVVNSVLPSVPEWVLYHHLQGFQHMFIYLNGDPSTARMLLAPLVRQGIVTVVDWHWPPRWRNQHMHQQAQQNSCLLRARGRAKWVALNDVDEFFQPRGNNSNTVAEWLAALEPSLAPELGALRVNSWWFGRLESAQGHRRRLQQHAHASPSGADAVLDPCSLVTATFTGAAPGPVLHEREKLLARPENVAYMSVHQITTGGTMQAVDPVQELRLSHFKLPFERGPYPVADCSMWPYAASVAAQMTPWCGGDELQQVWRGVAMAECGGGA